MQSKSTIGQTVKVIFPKLSSQSLPARIDTGAQTSAIWASSVKKTEAGLEVVFLGKSSPLFTGESILFTSYGETVVASSNGKAEHRYKVMLVCKIAGRRIRVWFTLANRSTQMYPVLLGRNILRGKFIVDVSVKGIAAQASGANQQQLNTKKVEA